MVYDEWMIDMLASDVAPGDFYIGQIYRTGCRPICRNGYVWIQEWFSVWPFAGIEIYISTHNI